MLEQIAQSVDGMATSAWDVSAPAAAAAAALVAAQDSLQGSLCTEVVRWTACCCCCRCCCQRCSMLPASWLAAAVARLPAAVAPICWPTPTHPPNIPHTPTDQIKWTDSAQATWDNFVMLAHTLTQQIMQIKDL